MSYVISISGHSESAEGEAKALAAVADLVEAIGADGAFSFSGQHITVTAGSPEDAVARARAVVSEYDLGADADDRTTSD